MYVNQYELLESSWKDYFEFLSLKKIDHKDLNPFKLKYNENLFKVLYDDQKRKRNRGKDAYHEIAQELFDKTEKEHFTRNKEGISLDSLEGLIKESDIITGIHLVEVDEQRYPTLFVKCYGSTFTLNEDEVSFLCTALPCHLDNDSEGITISIAKIPIMKKFTSEKEILVFKWAQRKSLEQVRAYHAKVFNYPLKGKSLLDKAKDLYEDILVKYFM